MHDANMKVLLAVTAALFVIVIAARLCGRLALKLGQPAVVGEMVSGVLLGPTLLGALAPSFSDYVFGETTKPTLYVISMTGLSLYMFLVGLEHEHHPASRKEALTPIALALGGITLPLLIGGAAAYAIADDFRPQHVSVPLFMLFVGGALSVTAFPMLARVLQERRMVHTDFGGVAIRAAAVDDAAAWCVLAIVSALYVHGSWVDSLETIVPALVFVVAAFVLLPRFFRKPMQRAVEAGAVGDGLLVALLCVVLGSAWFTDYIGIYSVFGGFVCGVALPRVPGFAELVNVRLLQVVRCLFLPVFFAFSGLNTDLTNALDPSYLVALAIMLVAAFASKTVASLVVMRSFKWSWGESMAMGGLMNARGLMILIFINIGLALGIIGTQLFSILVLIAVLTTALALPVYRFHFTPEREAEARDVWRRRNRRPAVDSEKEDAVSSAVT
ncbi:cation:proton antiporter [Saccharomonospora sp. NB11]|jgi:Kef-type K+ transport system membrane component KefB|uniref:cation:proton antiporter n=1 Tax=Saccharomonospora sp. NB11 TaxID=1642298 RepID=UPI0018D1F1A5|nr:cation:proton antiporter [Saccharomonospora sp. NB11]